MTRPAAAASSAVWIAEGERHLAARRIAEATACYEHAVQLEPNVATYWARLGKLHMATREFDRAVAALTRATSLEPGIPDLHTMLAYALREQNQTDAAVAASKRALALAPDDVHCAFAEALMVPPIYADAEDAHAWRARFAAGLQRLHDEIPRWQRNAHRILDLEWTNFLLAYQGENDVELQRGYSALVAEILKAAVPSLQAPLQPLSRSDGKIRVGFVSAYFHACTVGDYFRQWIIDLPRDRFHVETFYTGHVVDDHTRAIEEGSDAFTHMPDRCDRIASAVRGRSLDVAVLPDIGMNARSVLLANLRLAPIQCAAWGHPVTTGSAAVDYYVTCAGMEPADAATHYSEALMPLPGIGVRYRPPSFARTWTRGDFGLPESPRLYLCPQSLCKIHPDNDALFIDLLLRDESASIVFFAGQSDGQTAAFGRRLSARMRAASLPPRQRILFLPRMSREAFSGVLQIADVMIDTLRWSGGNTTLDALAQALPVVTLEGRFMRGRQTAAMLRILGVDELIAEDRERYLALALRIASDRLYRDKLARRIRDALPKLFDRTEPIEALAGALERAVRDRSPR